MKVAFVFLCIMIVNVLNIDALLKLIVRTTNGFVRGKLNYYGSLNNFTYYSFQGIPYGENPSGALRFQPPVPKRPWTHVLDATQNGVVCPQWNMRYKFEQMSEDCLHLNIYVPADAVQDLPVFVFIHGGGFALLSGSSDYLYGPQFFLHREMIVVMLNFRFGPLGFLSLDINEASGNAGIKDIILALKWIKKNISIFGGNSNKITIGGHSSGAALVHYLLLTKKTDGLFQQAILISGSALNYRFLSNHPKYDALSLAKKLGIKSNDPHIILRKLQQTDVFEIVEAFKQLSSMDRNILKHCNIFVPCVEKHFSHAVITENPMEILKTVGLIQNVPVLTGINAHEGIYLLPEILSNSEAVAELYNNDELCIPTNIEYPKGSRESRQLGNSISEMYFPSDHSDSFNISLIDKLLKLTSDIRYNYNVYAWIKLHKSNPKSNKLYFYEFNFDGDLNWAKLNYGIKYSGTSHADELGYIFVTNRTINRIENANYDSKHMINVTVNMFSNFIKFSTQQRLTPDRNRCDCGTFSENRQLWARATLNRLPPPIFGASVVLIITTMDGGTSKQFSTPQHNNEKKWPEFDMKDQKYLLICTNSTVKSFLNSSTSKRLHFWENAYIHYQQYMENGGKLENKCRNQFIYNFDTC